MSLSKLLSYELNTADIEILKIAEAAVLSAIVSEIEIPEEPRFDVIELIVVRPEGDRAWSINLANLARVNPLNPAFIPAALSAEGISTSAPTLAFIIALTALAARPVQRDEAMTLLLAHRESRFDKTFTLQSILNAADTLRDDFGVIKNSATDIKRNLAELERAGCIAPSPNGYRIQEKIAILPF